MISGFFCIIIVVNEMNVGDQFLSFINFLSNSVFIVGVFLSCFILIMKVFFFKQSSEIISTLRVLVFGGDSL